MKLLDWTHKQEWRQRGKNFSIVVSLHTVTPLSSSIYQENGPYRWCVYAYIYPAHPLFAEIDHKGDMFQEAVTKVPLHWGCSLVTSYINPADLSVASIKIGADYNHINDSDYTMMSTPDEASSVFDDAHSLYNFMEEYGQ